MCTQAEIVVRGETCNEMKKVGRVYFKSQSECQHPLTERCTPENDGGESVVSHMHIVPNQLRLAGYECSGPSLKPAENAGQIHVYQVLRMKKWCGVRLVVK